MNILPHTDLIERATANLRQIGLEVVEQPPPAEAAPTQADGWLRIGRGGEGTLYLVEARRVVTPGTLGAIVAQLRDLKAKAAHPVFLVADYVTPPVAEKLREHRQPFADAAGNAYLDAPGLLVYVTGCKPPAKNPGPRPERAFTTNGLKIFFALLCDPALAEAPQRAIAAAAGVALGAVPGVLAGLRANGHLLVAARHRRFPATKRLLDLWALAYAQRLRPKTLLATYRTPHFDAWKEWALDPEMARWGGEPAANLLVRHLIPGVLTLYAQKLPPRLLVEQRMVPTGPGYEQPFVEVRKPFWGAALDARPRPDTVPAVLVYADLLATGDARCIEAAQLVYETCLARLLPAG